METLELFAKGTMLKTRFYYKGVISIEDLWDLNTSALNEIYKTLSKKKSEMTDITGLDDADNMADTATLNEIKLQMEIVEVVYKYKKGLQEEAKTAADKKAKKQQLLQLINQKKNEELAGKSVEELQKMIDEL